MEQGSSRSRPTLPQTREGNRRRLALPCCALRRRTLPFPSHREIRSGSFNILREELIAAGFGKDDAPAVYVEFVPPHPDAYRLKLEQNLTEEDVTPIEHTSRLHNRTYTVVRFMPMRLRPLDFPLSRNETSERKSSP